MLSGIVQLAGKIFGSLSLGISGRNLHMFVNVEVWTSQMFVAFMEITVGPSSFQ